jgi:hypothetical protein
VQTRRELPPGEETPPKRNVSARSVNREVGTVVNLLKKGVAWDRIGTNPLKGLKPLRHET